MPNEARDKPPEWSLPKKTTRQADEITEEHATDQMTVVPAPIE